MLFYSTNICDATVWDSAENLPKCDSSYLYCFMQWLFSHSLASRKSLDLKDYPFSFSSQKLCELQHCMRLIIPISKMKLVIFTLQGFCKVKYLKFLAQGWHLIKKIKQTKKRKTIKQKKCINPPQNHLSANDISVHLKMIS